MENSEIIWKNGERSDRGKNLDWQEKSKTKISLDF